MGILIKGWGECGILIKGWGEHGGYGGISDKRAWEDSSSSVILLIKIPLQGLPGDAHGFVHQSRWVPQRHTGRCMYSMSWSLRVLVTPWHHVVCVSASQAELTSYIPGKPVYISGFPTCQSYAVWTKVKNGILLTCQLCTRCGLKSRMESSLLYPVWTKVRNGTVPTCQSMHPVWAKVRNGSPLVRAYTQYGLESGMGLSLLVKACTQYGLKPRMS